MLAGVKKLQRRIRPLALFSKEKSSRGDGSCSGGLSLVRCSWHTPRGYPAVMQKMLLRLGAELSDIKPGAVSSHQAAGSPSLQQFCLEIRAIDYLIQDVNTSLPCTEFSDRSGKSTSFPFKVVVVLLSVHGRLLLVAHWSVQWGRRLGWRGKGWFDIRSLDMERHVFRAF